MSEDNLYHRLGERSGTRTVVDDFYDRLLADPSLGRFFDDADLDHLRKTQTTFLCDAAGGPETYDDTPVREAHLDVPFEPHHIAKAIEILESTLDDHGVPDDDVAAVVEAIAQYEADLLASPEEP